MVEWGAVGIVWVFFLLVVMPLASLALSIAIPIFCGLCIVWVRKKQRHATWLAFPIIFFGGYFLVWGYSTINLLAVLLEYRSNNPVATVSFDPMKEAIVFPQMAEMELNDLVLTYDLPDLYEIMPGNWGGIQRISARSPSDCAALRLQNSSKTPKNDGGGRPDGICVWHEYGVGPDQGRTAIDMERSSKDFPPGWMFFQNGKKLGPYRRVATLWMLPIPFVFMGCGFVDVSPGFKCEVSPLSIPVSGSWNTADEHPEDAMTMLGIPKRTPEQVRAIVGNAS